MGSIMENAIGQELRARGFDLHYFNSRKGGEVDFLVQDGRKVIPVEVKSGNDWRSHKALSNMLDVSDWGIDEAFVLCKGDVERSGNITYLPLYLAMFLQPTPFPKEFIYEVDLSLLGAIGE